MRKEQEIKGETGEMFKLVENYLRLRDDARSLEEKALQLLSDVHTLLDYCDKYLFVSVASPNVIPSREVWESIQRIKERNNKS